jgi:hypothetical protein
MRSLFCQQVERSLRHTSLIGVSTKKTIYLVRDVRDVLLSEHAFQQALGLCDEDLDKWN